MMLTHQLSILAHDLAGQCYVGGTKPEDKLSFNHKSRPFTNKGTLQMEFPSERQLSDSYELEGSIGKGGFGSVYAGTCKKTGIPVAIKVIPKKKVYAWCKIGDRVVPKEVALMHSLRQRFIIRMLDHFEDSKMYYIVMERPEKYIDLFDYITQKGTVSDRSSRYLFRQILEAVQYCLSMGILHRDVKDENILIDLKSNQVKLIDFGSGTFLQEEEYTEYEGTRVCCPPEWELNQRYHGIPATVWSLGILLYTMLLGDIPFVNSSEIITAHLSFHVSISKDAENLIRWMLSVRPRERPTIEQIFNHPWLKTSSSSSSSSTKPNSSPGSSSTSLSSYSSALLSSGSSSKYCKASSSHHKHAYCHQSSLSPNSSTLRGSRSSQQVLGNNKLPCSSSPIKTRSQSRLYSERSPIVPSSPLFSHCHDSLAIGGGCVGSRGAQSYHLSHSKSSASSYDLNYTVPRTPLQSRKVLASQVPMKK